MKWEATTLVGVVGLFIAFLLLVFGVLLSVSAFFGWVFMLLWNLAIVPLGAPELNFWAAWAIWFLLSLVLGRNHISFRKKD